MTSSTNLHLQADVAPPLAAPNFGVRRDAGDDMADALRAVLDALGLGVLLVNDALVVRYANRAASHQLGAAGQTSGGDFAIDIEPGQRWQLLGAVRRAGKGEWSMLMLGSAGRARPVGVAPLRSTRPWRDAVAVLVLGGEPQQSRLTQRLFCQAHRLTLAECHVLEALSDGLTPKEATRQGGVALSTVRTQIASIREKTGTSTIGHLLQRVSSLPPLMGAALTVTR